MGEVYFVKLIDEVLAKREQGWQMHQSNDYKYSDNRSDPTKYIEEKVAVNHDLDRLAVGAKLIRERQERFIDRCTMYYAAILDELCSADFISDRL